MENLFFPLIIKAYIPTDKNGIDKPLPKFDTEYKVALV